MNTIAIGILILVFLIFYPASPFPTAYNPTKPLNPREPRNFVTNIKVNIAAQKLATCQAVLDQLGVSYGLKEPKQSGPDCGINPRLALAGLGDVSLETVETNCAIAMRFALWDYHVVRPAAQAHFQADVTRYHHLGSFSCRRIRTENGPSARMSEHARANAIDIAGLRLSDGVDISLREHWNDPEIGPFLQEIHAGACDWFRATLGPDYNQLHADHFHLDAGRITVCK